MDFRTKFSFQVVLIPLVHYKLLEHVHYLTVYRCTILRSKICYNKLRDMLFHVLYYTHVKCDVFVGVFYFDEVFEVSDKIDGKIVDLFY